MKNLKTFFLLAALAAAAILAYLPGLSGDLVFDDRSNLEPVRLWTKGEIPWQQVVFDNQSGPLGRPVAMGTFVINAAISGDSVWGLKAGNLVLHLISACLLFFLLTLLSSKDKSLHPYRNWLPFVITAIWLLHPLLVSTVLYVVQRMAMLSALFTLATLIGYMGGRRLLDEGAKKRGVILLFVVVPSMILLAALSKENGLLAPLFCVLLEYVYFRPKTGERRPWPVQIFVTGTLTTLAAGTIAVAIFSPGLILDGYANRHFTIYERILTQSRVLFDYVGNLLIPVGPKLSLFRDNYPLSTGLLSPPSTLISISGWIALIAIAIKIRKTIPGFSAGIGIFMIGHAMESSVFPLMLYFEHRNYLSSVGVFWAIAALVATAAPYLVKNMSNPTAVRNAAIIALVLVLAGATHMRATIWQSNELMARQSLNYYPDSRLLRMELAQIEMENPFGQPETARDHMRALTDSTRSSTRMIGRINLINIDCLTGTKVSENALERAFLLSPDTVEADLYHVIDVLHHNVRRDLCKGITRLDLADTISRFAQSPKVAAAQHLQWRAQFIAAKLYHEAGHLNTAHQIAKSAWTNAPSEAAVGLFLARLKIELGLYLQADHLIATLNDEIPRSDTRGRSLLALYSNLSKRRFGAELLNNRTVNSPAVNLITSDSDATEVKKQQ